jgi:hypothetical protein
MLAGSAHVSMGYVAAEERYAPPQVTITESFGQWRADGYKRLPLRRIDLVGRSGEAFAAQMNGSIDALRLSLSAMGWSETPKWSWSGALPYLNPSAALAELPPRPALHEGLQAKFTAIRAIDGSPNARLVLRAFKTNRMASMRDKVRPIYLISITREILRHGFNLYAVPSGVAADAAEIEAIRAGLDSAGLLHRVQPVEGNAVLYFTQP